MLRTLAERMSRSVVLQRRLPRAFGRRRLFVSPDVALRFWRPSLQACDPQLFQQIDEFVRAGDLVFDVGASVGLFAFAAAQRAGPSGRVVAVEPDAWLTSLLHRSAPLALAGEAPVSVVCAAVSESVGFATFAVAQHGRGSSFLIRSGGRHLAGGAREQRVVPTVTVDSLMDQFGAPSVLKIDVEGSEALVLRGAEWVLSRHRPLILCEIGPTQWTEAVERLRSHCYELFDVWYPVPRPPLSEFTYDVIACPRERVAVFSTLRFA